MLPKFFQNVSYLLIHGASIYQESDTNLVNLTKHIKCTESKFRSFEFGICKVNFVYII